LKDIVGVNLYMFKEPFGGRLGLRSPGTANQTPKDPDRLRPSSPRSHVSSINSYVPDQRHVLTTIPNPPYSYPYHSTTYIASKAQQQVVAVSHQSKRVCSRPSTHRDSERQRERERERAAYTSWKGCIGYAGAKTEAD
jgi:hypothetical protein